MARVNSSGAAPTPLQQVTQFFLTAPIAEAVAAGDVAATIIATRLQAAGNGSPVLEFPPAATQEFATAPGLQPDGRVRRGRPRRVGLPTTPIVQVAPGVDGQIVTDLPPQGSPDGDA